MAFGKKKSKDEEEPIEALAAQPEADEGDDTIRRELFASSDAALDAEPPAPADPSPVEEAPPMETPAETRAAESLGGPDLLSMFQTTTLESDDKAALLELAGEVELDDLLEDLQTVAAALGIKA